ncbi:hypothetical protein M433DRAFT_328437 [Acidomyces richmondensis BFW]|nr:hypothetical protein M433DRAFT_328437 [Acidomyces richmondensis BFW]
MNQMQHDELAQLFAQSMQLSHTAQQTVQQQHHLQSQPAEHTDEKVDKEPVHYISSHYTQTAHIRPDTTSEPSRSPPPPYHEALMPEAMVETLRQHSIDPSALLPNQIHLFQNADYEQRLRLLELWRIAPPSYPLETHLMSGKWTPTSVEREEADARASPIRDAGEPAWPPAARMRAASIASKQQFRVEAPEAEPYIVNGYHAMQPARNVDPVYAAAAGLWQAPSYAHAVQEQSAAMENQYGMYEQIRNHADWEAMNERTARDRLMNLHGPVDDNDMVM